MFKRTKNLTAIFILFVLLVSSLALFVISGAITSYAQTTTYTITFNPLNGKTAREQTVVAGQKATEISLGDKSKGVKFQYWADEDGNVFDFDAPIEKDTVLFARYAVDDVMILSEFVNDYVEEDTKLLYLNGEDNQTTVNDPGVVDSLNIDANNNSIYYVHSYGFVKYPSVRFMSGINVVNVEDIVFRINVHLSSPSAKGIDNSVGGFAVAGIESTGLLGECIVLDSDVAQDSWIDFRLNRYQASVLADENGQINGLAVISNFKHDPSNPPKDGTSVYSGGIEYNEGGYVSIDYVGFTEKDDSSCLVTMITNNGEKPTFTYVDKGSAGQITFVPEKIGYEFSTWVTEDDVIIGDSDVINDDIVLYAEYVKPDDVKIVTIDDNVGNVKTIAVNVGDTVAKPVDPVREGYDFVCWADDSGNKYDFTKPVTEDLNLTARYFTTDGEILAEFDADFYTEKTALTSLNGMTNMTEPLSDPYERGVEIVDNGNIIFAKYQTHSWGFIKYPTIKFAPIKVKDVESLTIRIYVHLNEGLIDTRYGGFALSSATSDGSTGTCFTLDSDILQDEWFDLVLSPSEAQLFADANGYITGISAISNFKYDTVVNPTTDGSGVYIGYGGFVAIDTISYKEREENSVAVYIDALNGSRKTVEFISQGASIQRPAVDPVRNGYDFIDWVDEYGNAFDFTKPITEDLTIYARYKKGREIVLSDFNSDYEVTKTNLVSLNGMNNVNTVNDPIDGSFTERNENGVTYGNYGVACWGFIKYPSIKFAGVHVDDIKYLKIRVYVHLNDGKIDNRFGGFAFSGLTATGNSGECYSIPADIVQDQWVDIVISPFNLKNFADENGYITGLAVISNFKYDLVHSPTTDGSGIYPYGLENPEHAYVLVDSVTCEEREANSVAVMINNCNGDDGEVLFVQKGQVVTVPTSPVKSGCIFNKWVDQDGNAFDFTQAVNADLSLYATYKTSDGSDLNLLLDFDNDYISGEYSLENINGNNRRENYIKFKVVEVQKPLSTQVDGQGISYGVFSTLNYGSVIYPTINFIAPVEVKDIDYLTIRLYVHLWDGNYDTSRGGFVLCGANGSGLKNECYMLAEGIKQDEWIDIVMTRSEAALFADSEGKISGIQIGSMFTYNPASNTTGKGVYVGSDGYGGYVYVDHIAYKESANVNQVLKYDVTFNGYTTAMVESVDAYHTVNEPLSVPVKSGYKFSYWALNGKKFDFEKTVITANIELDPVFVYDYIQSLDYVGVYTLGNRTLVLNSDGTFRTYVNGKLYSSEKCVVLSNGNVFVNDNVVATYNNIADTINVSGNEYSRGGGFVITLNYGGNEIGKLAVYGNALPQMPVYEKANSVFKGWYYDQALNNKAEKADVISSDLILYAKYSENVVTVTLNYGDDYQEQVKTFVIEKGSTLTIDLIPERENSVFVGWVLKNGNDFDFSSTVNSDLSLYASFENTSSYLTTADKALNQDDGSLEMVDGIKYKANSGMYEPYWVETERVEADGALNGYAYKTSFHTWAITVATNVIVFDNLVNVNNIDGLTVRMYAYLSSSSKYDTQTGGIKIYGDCATGKVGEGIMIPENVKQNEWFDFTISKEDCLKLANSDGNIKGLQIGSSLFIADMNLGYEGVGMMYILIDYVSITENVEVTFSDGGKTYQFNYYKGDKLEKNYIIPQKDGYMFAGWVDGQGKIVSKNTIITEDVSFTATWIEKDNVTAYKGYYVDENGNTIIIDENITVKDNSSYDGICLNDGKIYILVGGQVTELDLANYNKVETIKVTYDYLFGKETYVYPKNSLVIPLDLSQRVSGFKGYLYENGQPVSFGEGFSQDVTVYADIEWTEITDYTEYVGWYKLGDDIVKLTKNKKLEISGSTVDCVICEGFIIYQLGGQTKYANINSSNLIMDGNTYVKLGEKVVVSFATGGVSREPEKFEVGREDGYKLNQLLHTVSANGFKFLGWYDEYGNKVDEYSTFYESVQLFAKWEKIVEDAPEESGDFPIVLVVVISVAVLVVAGATVTTIILVKRRNKK